MKRLLLFVLILGLFDAAVTTTIQAYASDDSDADEDSVTVIADCDWNNTEVAMSDDFECNVSSATEEGTTGDTGDTGDGEPLPGAGLRRTCEDCLERFLDNNQLLSLARLMFTNIPTTDEICGRFTDFSEDTIRLIFQEIGVSGFDLERLIGCLRDAGIVFA